MYEFKSHRPVLVQDLPMKKVLEAGEDGYNFLCEWNIRFETFITEEIYTSGFLNIKC